MVSPHRTAVLVVRAWVEDHPTAPLRIRLTDASEAGAPEPTTTAFASIDEACEAVRRWLEDSLRPGDAPVTDR